MISFLLYWLRSPQPYSENSLGVGMSTTKSWVEIPSQEKNHMFNKWFFRKRKKEKKKEDGEGEEKKRFVVVRS